MNATELQQLQQQWDERLEKEFKLPAEPMDEGQEICDGSAIARMCGYEEAVALSKQERLAIQQALDEEDRKMHGVKPINKAAAIEQARVEMAREQMQTDRDRAKHEAAIKRLLRRQLLGECPDTDQLISN